MKLFTFDQNSRRLFAIGLPIIIQNFVNYIQLQTDMAMLGHYNTIFLAAVGNVTFPYIILTNFLLGISTGTTVMIAHSIGAKKITHAKRYGEVSFFYNSLISVPFFLVLFLLPQYIMTALGTTGEVNLYGTEYMELLSYSLLFIGIEMSVTSMLQGMGITKHIMISGIIKMFVNIVLDWGLIYGNWGFPEMGIKGAALATTIASAVAAVYLLVIMYYSRAMTFKPGIGLFYPTWSVQKKNIRIGLPTGLEAIMWALAQIVIVRIINEIDEMSAGIYLMVIRIQAVTFFIYIGIARGTMTLIGQKLGAGNFQEALKVGILGLKFSFIFCIVAALLFISIPEEILSIFTSDQKIIELSAPLFILVAITIFPVAVNVVMGHAIRGMQDAKWMFYTQTFGAIFTISGSAIIILVLNFNILGIFFIVLVDEIIRANLNFFRFYKGKEFSSI